MRNILLSPQLSLGQKHISDIKINLDSRDDIPRILLGLQSVYESVVARDTQVAPTTAMAVERKAAVPVTLREPASAVLGQGVPVALDSAEARKAEYAAKLQALEKAYQISRESLRREYGQPVTTAQPAWKR